ncbi:MAG TPA: hypothetical protein VG621_03810 [Candidatus Paceibacterota bacterium]|nr:hypothetical protein [Candidatus Paceibacterota bacterium]
MKRHVALLFFPLIFLMIVNVLSNRVYAQTTPSTTATTTAPSSNTGIAVDVHLDNPLKVSTIQDAVQFFVNTLIKVAIPFVVVFFIWSGLKFILAQGNPTKITAAKKMFWYTVIGMLLIFGAWTITNAIIGTVNSIVS